MTAKKCSSITNLGARYGAPKTIFRVTLKTTPKPPGGLSVPPLAATCLAWGVVFFYNKPRYEVGAPAMTARVWVLRRCQARLALLRV